MKNKIMMGLALTALISSAHAAVPQDITVCINVSNNSTLNTYKANFKSSDLFDIHGTTTKSVSNGESCASHHYKHGYKRITLKVSSDGKDKRNQAILLDKNSCGYMHPESINSFKSDDKMRTHHLTEVWRFNLVSTPIANSTQNVFTLTCMH